MGKDSRDKLEDVKAEVEASQEETRKDIGETKASMEGSDTCMNKDVKFDADGELKEKFDEMICSIVNVGKVAVAELKNLFK